MTSRIEWVRDNCRLLKQLSAEYKKTRPFEGLTIGTGIHLEPKTVTLLLTLKDGGARVVSTGNLNSTQKSAVDYLREHGVEVIGEATRDKAQHLKYLQAVLAENEHAVGQSVLESYMRITNRVTNGQRVTVFGYGACGMGVAYNFRNANAKVSVVDTDPLKRLQAHLDGFDTPSREDAIRSADVIVTVSGGGRIIGGEDIPLLKNGVILANAGHFPVEIDVDSFARSEQIENVNEFEESIASYQTKSGKNFKIITEGHMFNLAGPRPLGNSIESMDLGFALQSLCLEAVARKKVNNTHCVVPVTREIDEKVANMYIDLIYSK
ncbi:adenosylhomocysteinase [Salmonella enterica]|nr:adenosylhomocysteinase [Salmonella enterica]